ncbi:hypothetical protein [Pseudomonas sp. COR18]|uniref:hypothetical protein n=1 Tax=Pseudomonas sp. COR18 TaxID=3399680 RepID=UPI003B004CEC
MSPPIKMSGPGLLAVRENSIKSAEASIEYYKNQNTFIDKLISTVNCQPQKGFLKLDKENSPYLNEKLTIGIITGKHRIENSRLPENIRNLGIDLKFGKMTSRADIISKLENRKSENKHGIETNNLIIKNNREKIAEALATQKEKPSEKTEIQQEKNNIPSTENPAQNTSKLSTTLEGGESTFNERKPEFSNPKKPIPYPRNIHFNRVSPTLLIEKPAQGKTNNTIHGGNTANPSIGMGPSNTSEEQTGNSQLKPPKDFLNFWLRDSGKPLNKTANKPFSRNPST